MKKNKTEQWKHKPKLLRRQALPIGIPLGKDENGHSSSPTQRHERRLTLSVHDVLPVLLLVSLLGVVNVCVCVSPNGTVAVFVIGTVVIALRFVSLFVRSFLVFVTILGARPPFAAVSVFICVSE